MTPLLIAVLCAVMVGTAFLSGLFGMAGGLVLMGVLLVLLPLPDAMALHAVTQMASNGWRALLWWRHVRWSAVWAYAAGCALALALWSAARFVPDKPLALLFLGLGPFAVWLLPAGFRPDPERLPHGLAYGAVCMSLLLLTFGHGVKLLYFGALIEQTGSVDPALAAAAILASMAGTTLARRFLEAMTDRQYRLWANRLVTAIASYYVVHGTWLLAGPA
jgi:uncharacterized membrane protein YfcA